MLHAKGSRRRYPFHGRLKFGMLHQPASLFSIAQPACFQSLALHRREGHKGAA